jgi:hypothetical protein
MKKLLIRFLIIVMSGSSYNYLFSQNESVKPSRQSSMEAFSKGNYEKAYREFKVLLLTYTKDPLYKYYSGVCLVKLNREPAESETLLKQAIQSAAVVKTLPSDALFYLGRSQQMGGKFNEAIGSYNSYMKQVGKKTAREYNVPDFVRQCNEKKGNVAEPETKIPVTSKSEMNEVKQGQQIQQVQNVQKVQQIEPESVLKDTISKEVEKESPAKKNLPIQYEKILDEALEFQIKADSLNTVAAMQKKQLENLPAGEKSVLKVKISDNEIAASSYQRSADQKYSEAQTAMNPQSGKQAEIRKPVAKTEDNNLKKDTIRPDTKNVKIVYNQIDTGKTVVPVMLRPAEIFTVFEIVSRPPDPKEKVSVDPEVPEGLIYRIQVAVFRNPVSPSFFKGLTPVYGFKVTGTDRTNYYVGMFRRSADASKALFDVKSKGFKDAFVVPLLDKKTVSADRAAVLEKEWGKKPLGIIMNSGVQTPVDTIPPTLSFRVLLMRSSKPVKDDVVEGMRKMAGNNGLDIQSLDDGNIAYLIGKFITFENAAEYADLLVRNGYREAKVIAWLGKKEIPVETARQLVDNMK